MGRVRRRAGCASSGYARVDRSFFGRFPGAISVQAVAEVFGRGFFGSFGGRSQFMEGGRSQRGDDIAQVGLAAILMCRHGHPRDSSFLRRCRGVRFPPLALALALALAQRLRRTRVARDRDGPYRRKAGYAGAVRSTRDGARHCVLVVAGGLAGGLLPWLVEQHFGHGHCRFGVLAGYDDGDGVLTFRVER